MSRILVFDSKNPGVVTGGANEDMSLAINTPRETIAVRLKSAEGNVPNISWHWLLESYGANSHTFEWFQKFYGDDDDPDGSGGILGNLGYGREVLVDMAPGGVVNGNMTHYVVTRSITMSGALNNTSLYFPMVVHATWVVLRLTPTTAINPSTLRLRIYAIVGGIGEAARARQSVQENKIFQYM